MIQVFVHNKVRMLKNDDPLEPIYRESCKSIEAAEKFIRTYPNERDLCAGVLLKVAYLCDRNNEKYKAIEIYQRAINEYGEEFVPNVNAEFTVKEWALLRIGSLERDIGNRDKALEIFDNLSQSSNYNVKRSARVSYLSIKQSHLKLKATVKLPKKRYSPGEEIKGTIIVKNPENEAATIECFVRIRRKKGLTYGSIEQIGPMEITLKAGQEYKGTFIFDNSRNGFEQETWVIDCDLNGVPVRSNAVTIKVVEKAGSAAAMGLIISLASICLIIVLRRNKMTKINSPSIMLVVSVLLLSICQGELYSAEIDRWDLMMIDSAHIWKNLLTNYPYAEHQKHWPERKTGLEQIVNKYPDSQWADDAALILACGKFEFEGRAGLDDLQGNSEAYAKGYFGNAEEAIKDLRTIIDSYPHAKSIIDPVWFAGLGCKFNGVWLSSQGGLVSLNSDGTIQTSKPFDRSGAIPQKHKEVLAYFDHLEKYPVYTKHIAHLFISEILGHQGKFSEAASELEKVLSDLSEFEKAVKADNVAANGPDGVLIKR